MIESIQKEFGIHNKTVGATTDSGSSFVRAFRLFSEDEAEEINNNDGDGNDVETPIDVAEILENLEEDEGLLYHLPQHYRCASHTTNLIATKDVKKANSNKEIVEALKSRAFCNIEQLISKLYALLHKFNTVLPSSAAVERLFSFAGGIFRKNCLSLKDESFEVQLMMKVNKKF
jgi:hypothetical protein